MKPSATVQLPISAFRDRVRDFDGDNKGLAEWIRNFSKALSDTNPEFDDFAGKLLNEVEDYREKEALRIQKLRNKHKSNKAQESSNNADAGTGGRTPAVSEAPSSAPASATSDGAAGPPGGTPPQQPPAGKPRRPSPDMLRGYTIPEMGDVWDFVHENRIPESVASEWYAWNEEMKWPPLKKGWKAALRGFAKKKEEE